MKHNNRVSALWLLSKRRNKTACPTEMLKDNETQSVHSLRIVLTTVALLISAALLIGCGQAGSMSGSVTGSSGDSGTEDSTTALSGSASAYQTVVIGSMINEDILPMWVAEAEDMFVEQGINATVETFQSAQELSTAVVSGSVDIAMTDIMVAATLTASGTPVIMEWVTLGASPDQGRFGILTNPQSGITTLEQLAGVPIGVGSCTVPEYVMDKLLQRAQIPVSDIVAEEIKKVPVRYEMMSSNQIAAAALPGSFLALGEATGMILLADDSVGENLSQSVMIARKDLAQTTTGIAVVETLAKVWNSAVERINANPENYRSLLVEKSQLPEIVQESYIISTYPTTSRPSPETVTPVLDWMFEKGYLSSKLIYDYTTGSFTT